MGNYNNSFDEIINQRYWKYSVVLLISLCATFLGLEISSAEWIKEIAGQKSERRFLIFSIDIFFTAMFTIEIIIRILAEKKWTDFFNYTRYSKDDTKHNIDVFWNVFDFLLVLGSIIAFVNKSVNPEFFFVARLLRVSRILRLFELNGEMKKIEEWVFRAIPTIGTFIVLFIAIIYSYAIVGTYLFGRCADCDSIVIGNFHDLETSIQTVVQLLTLDGWTELMQSSNLQHPILSVIYFYSFVFLIGIIFLNIFLAVLVTSIEENMEKRQNLRSDSQLDRIESLEKNTQEILNILKHK